jgi:hypothetical protein
MKGLGQLKNLMASLGIETATFRLVAQCLNQLRCRVPRIHLLISPIFSAILQGVFFPFLFSPNKQHDITN